MNEIVDFLLFRHPNIQFVVLGTVLLSISASVVGCFTFVKKKSLVGDVISHAVLPGICLSFMIKGTKDPVFLLIGAFISGWISLLAMDIMVRYSKLKEDTATSISLSVFFGIGIFLLTKIQQSGNATQSGINTFLFGNAAALSQQDVVVLSWVAFFVLLIVFLFYKEFKLLAFDPEQAQIQGLPVHFLQFILTSITVLAVVIGVQTVGVVLMAATLITPTAAAKYWTKRFSGYLWIAILFSSVSGVCGAFVSYVVPNMPTGPWIVVILSFLALISILFSPSQGIVVKFIQKNKTKKKLLHENFLKLLYKIEEWKKKPFLSLNQIAKDSHFSTQQLKKIINQLHSNKYLIKEQNGVFLTEKGRAYGKKIVKLHRLWELYLTEYLNIAADHVHENAETVEHILTSKLEKRLEELLEYPQKDPHDKVIPK